MTTEKVTDFRKQSEIQYGVGFRGRLDAGSNFTREILRDMQTAEVKKVADAVPRLQDDSNGLGILRGTELADSNRVYSSTNERKRYVPKPHLNKVFTTHFSK
ncbi:unnamed protein product [Euphydryas editha]|uniref:Uncharacterized protein n=1 Tax=Euphydryas editha TaxID=104508 RepID=A0AAU9U0P1_EUPED|nr:unnamed protein product [Euphydryas editha]